MKVRFVTLGCKVNAYETEAVWELLANRGYERVDAGRADVYIINTCMVTATAEQKSRQAARHLFRENPRAVIVVMGCLVALKPEDTAAIDGVVISLGTRDRDKIPDLLDEYFQTKRPISLAVPPSEQVAYDNLTISAFSDHQRAFLKIEDGCDNFCSYCIIPYARGRVRSKPRNLVLQEARELARHHVEIVLTGIHTGGYGKDLDNYTFADLLAELEQIEAIRRIRISSIEINELTPAIINLIATSKKIVRHLHVPLQSGSDRILKRMNRHYDVAAYGAKIAQLRRAIPELSLTTDVIAGFPGETAADFAATYDFVKTIGYQELHVFPYSKRTGTAAAAFLDEIDAIIKKDRVRQLLELGLTMAKAAIRAKEGSILPVIVEREVEGMLQGHSDSYIHLRFSGPRELIGKEVSVRLLREAYPLSLGELW